MTTTSIEDYYGQTPDDAGCIELAEFLERRRRLGLEDEHGA